MRRAVRPADGVTPVRGSDYPVSASGVLHTARTNTNEEDTLTTLPRRKDETPAERGLRLAQAVWDAQSPNVKAATRRPGAPKHGHAFMRDTRRIGGQTWASRAEPKGFIL